MERKKKYILIRSVKTMTSLDFKIGMTDSRSIRITSFFSSPSKFKYAIFLSILKAYPKNLEDELISWCLRGITYILHVEIKGSMKLEWNKVVVYKSQNIMELDSCFDKKKRRKKKKVKTCSCVTV